ncbi:MAG: ABC transporter substrate-binding protein, partial [Deltaproteobacteria bacterium]|nr:ABC transporter substrate-binding protein [Deltaproteobacteria bacterium]
PVTLLGVGILSGKVGAVPETGWGYVDGAAYINEHGGIAGRPYKVILEDGMYDVPTSVAAFNRALASEPEDELMFHSGFMTGVLRAIRERVAETKIVCVDGSMATHIFNENVKKEFPYYFSCGVPYGDQCGAILKFIKTKLHKGKGKPKVAFIYIEATAGKDPLEKLRVYAEKFGVDLVLEEPVTFTTTDYTPTMMKIRQNKAEYTILWSWAVPVSARFEKLYRKFFPKKPLLGLSYSAAEVNFKTAGKAHDGMYAFGPYPRPNETDNKLVNICLETAKKQGHEWVNWDVYVQSFLMSLICAEGAKRAAAKGPITRETCRVALENLKGWDIYGMYGGKTVDYGLHRLNRFRIIQAQWETKSNVPITPWYDIDEYLK